MENTVFNKRQIAIWAFIIVLFVFANTVYQENELPLFFALVFVSLAGMFVSFTSPLLFVFDKDKINIKYWFGFHEIILWSKVKSIEKELNTPGSIYLYNYCFCTWGQSNGKLAFFTKSEIVANKRTRQLIRKYWHDNFEK